jgi:hypothetical protein
MENFHHLATQKRGAARLDLNIFGKISTGALQNVIDSNGLERH